MNSFKRARILPQLTLLLILIGTAAKPAIQSRTTEILWDDWGVPHIFATNTEDLFRAFGWAQMHSHGNLLLRLYGQARGRAAEYWGQRFLESDKWVRSMGVPERALKWSEAQSKSFRKNLDAFAAGINQYARKHPDRISDEVRIVLPVNAVDIIAHAQRVINFTFVAEQETVMSSRKRWESKGSTAWAIAPARSASGHAMLLANPHLPWAGQFLFYESHLAAPGLKITGATLVGFPILAIAFNDYLGWSHTVNAFDGADTYELTLAKGGYVWNGKVEPFKEDAQTIRVKQPDSTLREEKFAVKRSVHGPVIAEKEGKAIALRVAGLDRPGMLEQWWEMGKARNVAEFEKALTRMQLPTFNVIYADSKGHIMYLFDGAIPVHPGGDWNYWSGIVPGDSSATLWVKTIAYNDLPKIIDPPNGWLQNSNDPPWTSTYPQLLDRNKYPRYLAPEVTDFRAQRSMKMLIEDKSISLDEMIKYKYSTRMELADRILDDLISIARNRKSTLIQEAADVLKSWDRCAEADSRGAVLFMFWAQQMGLIDDLDQGVFAAAWSEKEALTTPNGLADEERAIAALEKAASKVKADYGSLDVPWGTVARLRYGNADLPANGAPGALGASRVIWFVPAKDGRLRSAGGDSFIMAIEFSTPPKARALIAYGNSSQPGSPHNGDQFGIFARKELRPIWQTRAEINAHLESRDTLE